jgi:uncharacterized protein (TIGR02001 family)
VREAQFGGCGIVRLRAVAAALLVGISFATQTAAADPWGGSAVLSSDYFVRGISRTSDHAALQLELHYANSAGLLAGIFASNSQIDSRGREDAELSAFIGYASNVSDQWRAKIVASHYAYPWNKLGSRYDYDELDADLSFEGWLHFTLGYSPDSWRFYRKGYRTELIGASEQSAEISLQRPILGKLSLTGGAGYSWLSGRESGSYGYWSAGAAFDLSPVTLAVSYVDTSHAAKSLFYNAAASGQWMGTVFWRF